MRETEQMISVIMLTYNREQYVGKMIEDILQQSYRDFEFVIVDNGSTDKSGCIADEYAQKDERIQVIHLTEKHSIGHGRNVGFNHSRGEYIAYVDDDDRLEHDYLEYLMRLAETHGADIAVCGSNEFENEVISPQCVYEEEIVLSGKEAVKLLLERKKIRAGLPTKLVKRSLLKENPFVEDCYAEDIHTTYKLLAACNCLAGKGEPKYYCRRHANNNTSFMDQFAILKKTVLEEYIKLYEERCEYLTKLFPDEVEFWRYSVWSFYISMCAKIRRYHIQECQKLYDEMMCRLSAHKVEIENCSYLKEDERLVFARLEDTYAGA